MRNPLLYANNIIRVAWLRVRNASRLQMGWIQTFDKLRLVIERGGNVEIGSFNQNREKLYIGVGNYGNLKIGSHCFFNINSSITCMGDIEIGNNCKFGNNLVIVDHDHNYRARGQYTSDNPEFISSPIKIGNNVWVGANVTILRGTTIGDNCVIAAGSIVRGSVSKNTVYVQKRLSELRGVTFGNE